LLSLPSSFFGCLLSFLPSFFGCSSSEQQFALLIQLRAHHREVDASLNAC